MFCALPLFHAHRRQPIVLAGVVVTLSPFLLNTSAKISQLEKFWKKIDGVKFPKQYAITLEEEGGSKL